MLLRNEEYLRQVIFKYFKLLKKIYLSKCTRVHKQGNKKNSLNHFNKKRK